MRLWCGGRRVPWDNKNEGKEKRLCQDLRDKKRSVEPNAWSSASFFRQPAEERVCSSDLKKEYANIRKNTDV